MSELRKHHVCTDYGANSHSYYALLINPLPPPGIVASRARGRRDRPAGAEAVPRAPRGRESTESGSTAQQLKRVLSPKRYRKLMIICNAKNRSLLWILNRSALFRERSAILHISSHHPVVSKNVQGP